MRIRNKLSLVLLVSLLGTGCSNSTKEDHKHTFSEEWSYYCDGHFHKCTHEGCKKTDKVENHNFDRNTGKCECGYSYSDYLYGDCEHEWTDWYLIELPNCSEFGLKEKYCYKCGKAEEEIVEPDPNNGHYFVKDDSNNKIATCTSEGYKGSKVCLYCDKQVEGEVIPKLNHSFGVGVGLKDGITKASCNNCKSIEYELNINYATGYHNPQVRMNATSGENSMATWDVSGVIDSGTYDVILYASLDDNISKSRKWYNMTKPELCLNNQIEEQSTGLDADRTTDDDYKYYLKVNDSIYYPNVTKTWGELGYNANSYNEGEMILNLTISNATTISLGHLVSSRTLRIGKVILRKNV